MRRASEKTKATTPVRVAGAAAPGADEVERLRAALARREDDVERLRAALERREDEVGALRGELAMHRRMHVELYELAPVAYVTLDAQGAIVEANLALSKLLGTPRGRLLGSKLSRFATPRGRTALAELLAEVNEVEGKVAREVSVRGPDGATLHLRIEALAVAAASDRRVHAACFDVTERVRLEAELRRAGKLHTLGRLAATIAHDFNNVLLGVAGCAAVALDHLAPGSKARPFVEDVKAAALRGRSLTSKLLETEPESQPPPAVPADLRETLAVCEPLLRGVLGGRVHLRIRPIPAGLRVRIPVIEIEQILLNLAVNTRRAIHDAGRFSIEAALMRIHPHDSQASLESRPGRYVLIKVSDDGPGMDPATRARAFEPFFSGSSNGVGLGLGLATVREIVVRREGVIDLRSEVGRGTTIRILLPIADESPGVLSEAAPYDEPAPSTSPSPRDDRAERASDAALLRPGEAGPTVLVIEDDALSRKALEAFLSRRGYRVLAAENGVQALRLATSGGPFDVVVTDLGLPGAAGNRLAAAVRSMHRHVAVVYISGRDRSDPVVKRALRMPRTAFLRKPFELDELVGAIGMLLLRKQVVAGKGATPGAA